MNENSLKNCMGNIDKEKVLFDTLNLYKFKDGHIESFDFDNEKDFEVSLINKGTQLQFIKNFSTSFKLEDEGEEREDVKEKLNHADEAIVEKSFKDIFQNYFDFIIILEEIYHLDKFAKKRESNDKPEFEVLASNYSLSGIGDIIYEKYEKCNWNLDVFIRGEIESLKKDYSLKEILLTWGKIKNMERTRNSTKLYKLKQSFGRSPIIVWKDKNRESYQFFEIRNIEGRYDKVQMDCVYSTFDASSDYIKITIGLEENHLLFDSVDDLARLVYDSQNISVEMFNLYQKERIEKAKRVIEIMNK